jgi:hypothetical protein
MGNIIANKKQEIDAIIARIGLDAFIEKHIDEGFNVPYNTFRH